MITLLHNNTCSKSNCVLAYLQDQGIPFQLRDYRTDPLSRQELASLLLKLELRPMDIIRRHEAAFFPFNDQSLSDDELLKIIARHPELLVRPILIQGDIAVIGRPFESVVEFCAHIAYLDKVLR